MIIEKTEVHGWEAAIRGMRNPLNSWRKSDSTICMEEDICGECDYDYNGLCFGRFLVGPDDLDLMRRLANSGPDHGKFLRMIDVSCDITAPLYWWKEADTYKVGTVANSCSTMHKIHDEEFTLENFSHEHLIGFWETPLRETIEMLNKTRKMYLETKDKELWYRMIQLLPSSYNQKRTVHMNYAVLRAIHKQRKAHKLDEWREFCRWAESLPYAEELIVEAEQWAGEVKEA